jgi:hypothetical protein
MLRAVGEIDERGLWKSDGTSMTQWLGYRYCITYATAIEWVRVARALRRLPAIAAAYEAGRLSWDQVRPLTRFATPDTDERWAREAPSWRSAGLWQEARRLEQLRERDVEDTHRNRHLRMEWDEERTELCAQVRFGAEQGSAFERAVRKRSEEVVLADDPYEPEGARLADALMELVTGSSGEVAAPIVVVHADASVLTGEDPGGLAETEDGTRLTSEAVRRLACDARIEWMLERNGRAVGIGRRGRIAPGAVARALRFRDRTCVFPGCGRIRWLKAHHVVHWAHGGRTDLDNLVLLCHAHHRAVHEGGWSIRGRPGTGLRFHDPGGTPMRSLQERLAVIPSSAAA